MKFVGLQIDSFVMEYDQSKILYAFILHLVMIQSTIYKDS